MKPKRHFLIKATSLFDQEITYFIHQELSNERFPKKNFVREILQFDSETEMMNAYESVKDSRINYIENGIPCYVDGRFTFLNDDEVSYLKEIGNDILFKGDIECHS